MKKTSCVVAALICAFTVGCSNDSKKPVKTAEFNTESIIEDSKATPQEKAERLALASEQLVSPLSFMYANDVASQALAVDPKNKRAKYVKALVGPFMALKGVMARVQPIASRTEEGKAQYEASLKKLQEAPKHALRDFLLDGPADIKTEKDAQNFIDSIRASYTKQREFFKNNKEGEINLNLPEMAAVAEMDKDEVCYWTQQDGTFQQYCTEAAPAVLQYKANRADFEAIQQIIAGMEIYMVYINAYSYSGALAVSEKYKGDSNASQAEIRQALLADKDFATLRGKSLSSILSMGIDAIAGVRYAKSMKNQLCKSGTNSKSNRPGYLFPSLCVNEKPSSRYTLDQILTNVELVLKGGLYETVFEGENGSHKTSLRVASFFEGGIRDVRDLGLTINDCGDVTSAADSSLGGIFPKKDFNAVLALGRRSCEQ